MTVGRDVLQGLVGRSGRLLRAGLLSAVLAAIVSALLPGEWESTAFLLPPERRTDDFRYVQEPSAPGGALRRIVGGFEQIEQVHPLDVWEAVLGSAETADRLVDRFDLATRWGCRSREEAIRRLGRSLSYEAMPYGGFEIRVSTADRELSAALANAAAGILEERLRELYREDVAWERSFLEQAVRERGESAELAEAALVTSRLRSGRYDPRAQARQETDRARELVLAVTEARTARTEAARRHGTGSAEELDARRRLRELGRVAGALPVLPRAEPGERALEEDVAKLDALAGYLARLRRRTIEHEAAHGAAVHVLDPALPAESARRPLASSALLAFLFVPASSAGIGLLRGLRARLPPGALPMPEGTRLETSRGAGALLARLRAPATVVAAAAFGLLAAREPLVLVGLLAVVFLVVVAADVLAAWFLLVLALPWAWDYVNTSVGLEIQLPTEPGIALLGMAWAYTLVLRGPRSIRLQPLLVAIGLSIAWMVVSSATSTYLRYSFFQTVATCGFAIVGAVFPILEMRRIRQIERVLHIYLVSGVLLSVIGIVQVATSPLPFARAAFFIGEGLLFNHGPYTAFLGFAIGPAFVLLITERWSLRSLPLLAVVVLLLTVTVISLTRAAWISTTVLLLVLVAARARAVARKVVLPLALAGGVLVVAFLRSPTATEGLERYVEVSTSADYSSNVERINRWIAAGRMFLARPFTGVGPGAYEVAYEDYRDVDFTRGWRGSHSEILRAAAEQGLPGLAILGFLVVVFYRTGLRIIRTAEDPRARRLAAAICAGMLTYSVHGLFNEYWRVPKVALTLWVFVGLLGALERLVAEGESAAAPRRTGEVDPGRAEAPLREGGA